MSEVFDANEATLGAMKNPASRGDQCAPSSLVCYILPYHPPSALQEIRPAQDGDRTGRANVYSRFSSHLRE